MNYKISEIYKFNIHKGIHTTEKINGIYKYTNSIGEKVFFFPNEISIRIEKI